MFIRKKLEEKKNAWMEGQHENIGNKRKKLNNIGNIGGFVNIQEL